MAYSTKETKDQLTTALKSIDNLYKDPCVNRKGTIIDGNEYYTEIISKVLLSKLSAFNGIKPIKRGKPYFRKNHCNISFDICASNRDEEIFAKRITGLEIDKLGLILDFQIPIKDIRANKGLGKIDLISFHSGLNTLFLLELKYKGNNETLLRAILEGYTYSKVIDSDKLIDDLNAGLQFASRNVNLVNIPKDVKVEPAILLTPGCHACKELVELQSGNRPHLKNLCKKLGMKIYSIDFNVNEFIP